MIENTPYDILSFRKEVVGPILNHIKRGESFFVVGAPSVGKTRLLDFLMGDYQDGTTIVAGQAIREHYLEAAQAARTWLVRVDMNRIGKEGELSFRFYELLLSSLLIASFRYSTEEALLTMLTKLDSDVLENKDSLKAHRFFEMAVSQLCHAYSLKLAFMFDEFDETYKTIPSDIFAQLRAIRDANKYTVSYALFLRNLPEKLRSPLDNESFYELLSRNMVGLGPLNKDDALRMLIQQEKRLDTPLSPEKRTWICEQSGGHPGLLQGLYSLLRENSVAELKMADIAWVASQEVIFEELRKIWNGLLDDEKTALRTFINDKPDSVDYQTAKLLRAKGLVTRERNVFSPLLVPAILKMN